MESVPGKQKVQTFFKEIFPNLYGKLIIKYADCFIGKHIRFNQLDTPKFYINLSDGASHDDI